MEDCTFKHPQDESLFQIIIKNPAIKKSISDNAKDDPHFYWYGTDICENVMDLLRVELDAQDDDFMARLSAYYNNTVKTA